MLRLSRLTDYAVVVLVRLSAAQGVATSPGIAASIGIPEPTVAKVLKTLAGQGFVTSTRGAHGGYRLGRPLSQIAVSEVIVAIDGPIALTSCVDGGLELRESFALPDGRALGPGERRDPQCAREHHPCRHGRRLGSPCAASAGYYIFQ